MQNVQIFYGGPAIFVITCSPAQPHCRNVLPEHCNTIIKHQLCGEGLPSLLPLLPVDVYQKKQGILSQIFLGPSNKPKEACVRPFDTNGFSQTLTRKYHHTTESLYRLCDAKINRTPTLAGVSYQFGFVRFPFCLQSRISGSSAFFISSHEVSHGKVRKVTHTNF